MYSSNSQYPRAKIPVWQEFTPLQNRYFQSSPTNNTRQLGKWNSQSSNNFLGNESAAWMTPLPMGSGPTWGNRNFNQNFIQTVRQALGIVRLMPHM